MSNSVIEAFILAFESNKSLADRAIAQTDDMSLRRALDEQTNSIAVIMKHIAGNLRSRWTNFLDEDGEKPWRNRDDEFVDTFSDRAEVIENWERGWSSLRQTLAALTTGDLAKQVSIRGESMTVPDALARSLAHTGYHVGQIVQLARHFAGDSWNTLTIARGQSQQYNEKHWGPKRSG